MSTTLGTSIGRYRIARLIGGGSVGRVFACRSPLEEGAEDDRYVAVKMLRTKHASMGDTLLKLRRELERIQSPHVATIYDVAVFNNVVYEVMELVDGEPLSEHLKKSKLRIVDALAVAKGVVLGLQAGWAQGIAHGDVRPQNVLVPGGDLHNVKVVDFLLAPPVDGTETVRGSPAYIAPEILVGTPPDPLSDIYSVGCMLFECLAGRPPFVGSTASVLNAQANQKAPSLASLMPGPQAIVDLVERMLEKDRAKRIKTYGECIEGIDRALAGQKLQEPKAPELPAYEDDVDIDIDSFDHERTDEIHTSPARDSLISNSDEKPAVSTSMANKAAVVEKQSTGRVPRILEKPTTGTTPRVAAVDPRPPSTSTGTTGTHARNGSGSSEGRATTGTQPRAPAPVAVPLPIDIAPKPAASPPSEAPVDGIGVYRSASARPPAPVDDEHTRIDSSGRIAAIPSADDLGISLEPVKK